MYGLPEAVHGVPGSKLVPQVFRITVIGSKATGATLPVGNDHPVLHGVKAILLAQGSKQFHRRIIGALCHGLCGGQVGTSEVCPARVIDTGRFTHFNPNMGVVSGSASVPASVVPRKGLIHGAGVPVNNPWNPIANSERR